MSCHTTLEFLCWKRGVTLGDSNFCLLLRERNIFTYCGCVYCFIMLCVPLEFLVFFVRSFGRVTKAGRLEEYYLALPSFVSSHFCCSPVFSYLGVYSVLGCNYGKKQQNMIVKLQLQFVIPSADHCQKINV